MEEAERASEPAGRASKPAGMASEPAGKAPEVAERVRVSKHAGRSLKAARRALEPAERPQINLDWNSLLASIVIDRDITNETNETLMSGFTFQLGPLEQSSTVHGGTFIVPYGTAAQKVELK